LDVEYERVKSLQHLIGGALGIAVEAVNREAGRCVRRVGDASINLALDPVFRTEERNQFHAIGVRQDINRAPPLGIHSRLIGDQSNALATQRRKVLRFENVNSGLGACTRLRRSGLRDFSRTSRECYRKCGDKKKRWEETVTKHVGGGFVVPHATVCYIQPRDAGVNMVGSE
jgi:hypothetical protein